MSASRRRFQNRDNYRLRRLADAARLLPLAGVVLLMIPLLLDHSATTETSVRTSKVAFYVLGVWVLLILSAFVLSRGLEEVRRDGEDGGEDEAAS